MGMLFIASNVQSSVDCAPDRNSIARLVTRKPATACEEEITSNPRSRSAKLRVIERK